MKERSFTNYRLILPTEELYGTLTVREGRIAKIEPETAAEAKGAKDAKDEAQYLLPGLVELHTDYLETCLAPRSGVRWPLEAALSWYDRSLLAAGITTACAAVALREVPGHPLETGTIAGLLEALDKGAEGGGLGADHRINFRCELATFSAAAVLERFLDHPRLAVVSLMDHTPGQRQFLSVEKFRAYYRSRYHLTPDELTDYENRLLALDSQAIAGHRARIVALTQQRSLCLSTHDDSTPTHIAEAAKEGARVSEFPTTLQAARLARESRLQVLLGAPNVVLGRSHSNNLSAREVASAGLLDILSSDYAPQSLLHAAFLLPAVAGIALPEAVATVTRNPAQAIGLDQDRGTLEPGKRADLLTVRLAGGLPTISGVYRAGIRVA